ncbi:Rieske 2Fe-2S domain-containing protein [Fulvivirga sp. M361]|uniref:Rieske (2Fe-2S) protein n=1 Tax=Fulvivirga sp. M361 TaxID=2594266 RepID=UPI00117ABB04|nr:Rieske 2Fe-2S domain-containing protein [Fulvivirga sp. M361]TRX58347.1 Rieske 2Fe-2S domain-containing protein [Fulvivirga sp. M361]
MKWIKIFNSPAEAEQALNKRNPIRLQLGEKSFCLTFFEGRYYVTDNACPHQKESLSGGTINYLGEVICPLHFYRFSVKTGRECQGRTADLTTYPTKMDDSGFHVYV